MQQNIRAFVPGGTFFFTVTLLERCGKLMMLKAGCATLSRPTGFFECKERYRNNPEKKCLR
jgi:hypothetical protein